MAQSEIVAPDYMPPKTNRQAHKLVLTLIEPQRLYKLLGISRQAFHKWGDEIPESRVIEVSVFTGIHPYHLRPETHKAAVTALERSPE